MNVDQHQVAADPQTKPTCTVVCTHHHRLVLVTFVRTVEGWVNLSTAVMVHSQCVLLYTVKPFNLAAVKIDDCIVKVILALFILASLIYHQNQAVLENCKSPYRTSIWKTTLLYYTIRYDTSTVNETVAAQISFLAMSHSTGFGSSCLTPSSWSLVSLDLGLKNLLIQHYDLSIIMSVN